MIKLNVFRDRAHENGVELARWDGNEGTGEVDAFNLMYFDIGKMYVINKNNGWYISEKSYTRHEKYIDEILSNDVIAITGADFIQNFEWHIKDGFSHKITALIIRVLDLCGQLGIDVDEIISSCEIIVPFDNETLMGVKILELQNWVTYAVTNDNGYHNGYHNGYDEESIVWVIIMAMAIAEQANINIEKYLEMVLRYREAKLREERK